MKSLKFAVTRTKSDAPFQIHRLGLHEKMKPCMVDRPEGTRDYLFMLFHSEVRVKSGKDEAVWSSPSLMVWTPPDGHYYGNPDRLWDHSWFHCSGRDVGMLLRECRLPVRRRIKVVDSSVMEHFLLEITSELSGWDQPDAKILRNLFENFVRAVARHAFHKTGQVIPERLLALRCHIEQHFAESLRLKDLARRAGWSEPHLCTEFRRFFGIPIIQFMLQLRMSQATYLLRDHNRRIGEIAGTVGYPDIYAFSKMFKRHLGLSPRKFRQLNLRKMRR